jgi:hypothetical protein
VHFTPLFLLTAFESTPFAPPFGELRSIYINIRDLVLGLATVLTVAVPLGRLDVGAKRRVLVILNCVRIVIQNPCRGLISRRFVHIRRVPLCLHFISRPALTLGLIIDFRVIICNCFSLALAL